MTCGRTHQAVARRQPIWLLTSLATVPAISDHNIQIREIATSHTAENRALRDSDKRRKWDHLRADPTIGVVEVLADRPVLSAITPDQTIADIAGDTYLGSLPTVTDLADLIASPEVGAVADWIAGHAATWTPNR